MDNSKWISLEGKWHAAQYPDGDKAEVKALLHSALPHTFIYDAKTGNRIAVTLTTPYAEQDDKTARLMTAAPEILEMLERHDWDSCIRSESLPVWDDCGTCEPCRDRALFDKIIGS